MIAARTTDSARTLYVADDDADLRDALATVLGAAGFAVVTLSDGRSLLEMLAAAVLLGDDEVRPAAVIVDLQMPGFNGLEVVDSLRQYDTQTPVIVITAFPDEQLHREARRHDVAAVLSKPFSADALLAVLARLLD